MVELDVHTVQLDTLYRWPSLMCTLSIKSTPETLTTIAKSLVTGVDPELQMEEFLPFINQNHNHLNHNKLTVTRHKID